MNVVVVCSVSAGGSTELSSSQSVDVPRWLQEATGGLQAAAASTSASGAAILRRASSSCSRKSVRFADDEDEDVKKRVHFAPVHRYVDDSQTADDPATGGGDGASEMSFTNSDCSSGQYVLNSDSSSSGLYVVNCGQYHVGGGATSADSRPPIVAFRTFLPPEGSLV